VIQCIHSLTLLKRVIQKHTLGLVYPNDYQLRERHILSNRVLACWLRMTPFGRIFLNSYLYVLAKVSSITIVHFKNLPPSLSNPSKLIRHIPYRVHYCTSDTCGTHLTATACIFKSRRKIRSILDPEISVFSTNSFRVQHLSSPRTAQCLSNNKRSYNVARVGM
jgi:hypothetical protein